LLFRIMNSFFSICDLSHQFEQINYISKQIKNLPVEE
jgi:uncharacterized protein YlaI